MTTKTYLQQIYQSKQKIRRLENRREQLRGMLYAIGSPQDPDRAQPRLDSKVAALTDRINIIDTDIVDEMARLVDLIQTISAQIEAVPDERYRGLLHGRYVMCWTWEKVAVEMNMNLRWVLRLHSRALDAFARGH